jgi:epoxyqueuosine reductase
MFFTEGEGDMIDLLKAEAAAHGDKLQIVAVTHLNDLRKELEHFSQSEELNGFQQWIVNSLYDYAIPATGFTVRSIILVAVRRPFYADVIFRHAGRDYYAKCPVRPDFEAPEKYISALLNEHGFHVWKADNLPLKRLGVQGGLSEYGRNNITYVPGMGSNFSLTAFFSDMPCEQDAWRSMVSAKACARCDICIENCPTGAIRKDRFLIDNQICLSAINEMPGDFPDWLPATAHHTCYDCLRCQESCPMNKGQLDKMEQNIVFSEEDTGMLLEGKPLESFPEEARQKIRMLGMDAWYAAMPRNMKALMGMLGDHQAPRAGNA